jgi:hypothetical protein
MKESPERCKQQKREAAPWDFSPARRMLATVMVLTAGFLGIILGILCFVAMILMHIGYQL